MLFPPDSLARGPCGGGGWGSRKSCRLMLPDLLQSPVSAHPSPDPPAAPGVLLPSPPPRELFPHLVAATKELAAFVHCAPGDLALVPNATAALNAVMASVPLHKGDPHRLLDTPPTPQTLESVLLCVG